jgi:cation transport protein ChaC
MSFKITRQALLDGSLRALTRSNAAAMKDMLYRSEAEMAALMEGILSRHDMTQDLWVFGYGSLIWNPAFEFEEKKAALLRGWHRRFCLKMTMGRGTPELPGLMLALDHGGACKGVAYRIAAEKIRQELHILWQREMYGGAYHARWVKLQAGDHRFNAVTFVINRAHPRYLRELSVEETAAFIATGSGQLGSCREYLENTVAHLEEMGLTDAGLERIVAALPKCGEPAS